MTECRRASTKGNGRAARAFVGLAVLLAVLLAHPGRVLAQPGEEGEAPLPELEADRLAHRFFFDVRGAVFTRNVDFSSQAEREEGGDQEPHWGIGVGVHFPEGLNHVIGDGLGDFIGPVGIRLGYLIGGAFSPGGDALDLEDADEDAFQTQELQLGFFGALGGRGRGLDVILNNWAFFGELSLEAQFRGTTLPEGTRVKQSIFQIGAAAPMTIFREIDMGIDGTHSIFGVRGRYEFLQLSLTSLNPEVKGREPNHTFLFGFWLDWGLLDWLKVDADLDIGAVARSPSGVVVHFRLALVAVHSPPFWLNDHLQMLFRVEFDITMTNLGDRYLHDPNATGDSSSAIVWSRGRIEFGLRIWF